jgi:hypothetical protein
MLFFTRPILVFCGIAIALGLGADALFYASVMLTGSGILSFRRGGLVAVFGMLWLVAFAIGLLIAKKFGISLFR